MNIFWENPDEQTYCYQLFKQLFHRPPLLFEQDTLSHAGVLMSSVNNIVDDEEIDDDSEDTTKEEADDPLTDLGNDETNRAIDQNRPPGYNLL